MCVHSDAAGLALGPGGIFSLNQRHHHHQHNNHRGPVRAARFAQSDRRLCRRSGVNGDGVGRVSSSLSAGNDNPRGGCEFPLGWLTNAKR